MIGANDLALAAWHAFRHRRTTRDAITALRDRRLHRLIVHAHAHVPYYRALFELVPEIPLDENGKFQVSRLLVQSFYRPVEASAGASVPRA